MSNLNNRDRYRCLFFGMPCAFSAPILGALRTERIELVGVVTPAPHLVGVPYRMIQSVERLRRVPAATGDFRSLSHPEPPRFLVRDFQSNELLDQLAALKPDLVVVSCFPWLIPTAITKAAALAINVHPSLLPRHGGPDPLFWTYWSGESESGVSVHELTDQFDAGRVILQSRLPILDGEPLESLEQRLAAVGAELVSFLIEGLPVLPRPPLVNPALASYESKPTADDLIVQAHWSVDRARRFITGVAKSHGPLTYRSTGGEPLAITGLGSGTEGVEIVLGNGTLRVTLR